MAYGRGKRDNSYARLAFDVDAPKTVWMALAVSFAAMTVESAEDLLADKVRLQKMLREEWATLHENGIVPQRPR